MISSILRSIQSTSELLLKSWRPSKAFTLGENSKQCAATKIKYVSGNRLKSYSPDMSVHLLMIEAPQKNFSLLFSRRNKDTSHGHWPWYESTVPSPCIKFFGFLIFFLPHSLPEAIPIQQKNTKRILIAWFIFPSTQPHLNSTTDYKVLKIFSRYHSTGNCDREQFHLCASH